MKLININDPRLRQVSTDINFGTDDIAMLSDVLSFYYNITMKGKILGICCPQFGINKRMVLVRLHDEGPTIMINPKITFKLGLKKSQEGCESLGGKKNQWILFRPIIGRVTWYTVHGQRRRRWFTYKDMRIIQHEVDHLNGLLIDRGIKV